MILKKSLRSLAILTVSKLSSLVLGTFWELLLFQRRIRTAAKL
jgi:hypothetical protein